MRVTVIKTRELARTTWKNGLGTTREIARGGHGPDGWGWRLSLADVERDNAFSRFEGCERSLALLSGDGLTLHVDAAPPVRLEEPLSSLRFSGDVDTHATLIGGSTVDFNVITRRDAALHELLVMRPGLVVPPSETVALLLLDGRLTAPVPMTPWDVALVEGASSPWLLRGVGRGLVVRLCEPGRASGA